MEVGCDFAFLVFLGDNQVRLQTMPQPEPGQKPMFTGTFDCAMKTVRKEVTLWCCIQLQCYFLVH